MSEQAFGYLLLGTMFCAFWSGWLLMKAFNSHRRRARIVECVSVLIVIVMLLGLNFFFSYEVLLVRGVLRVILACAFTSIAMWTVLWGICVHWAILRYKSGEGVLHHTPLLDKD